MSRNDFNETWLSEAPMRSNIGGTYSAIVYDIKDHIQYNATPISIGNHLFKIVETQTIIYWYEINGEIVLGTELDIKPQGLAVSITGKNPKFTNFPPYASDLYDAILTDNHRSIRLFSDNQLTDEGLKLWKRLIMKGHHITLYDPKHPGQKFKTLSTPEELDMFFSDDDSQYYTQFVLSETSQLAETRGFFNTRRYRELAGLRLDD